MPTYEYTCKRCGQTMEFVQSFSEKAFRKHQECGGELQKVFHARGVAFKGSGFYSNDSRSKSANSESSKSRESESGKSRESESGKSRESESGKSRESKSRESESGKSSKSSKSSSSNSESSSPVSTSTD